MVFTGKLLYLHRDMERREKESQQKLQFLLLTLLEDLIGNSILSVNRTELAAKLTTLKMYGFETMTHITNIFKLRKAEPQFRTLFLK
ncbi:hypothetical protein D5Z25_11800 [Staphylococcus pseudintermedius]|nr:hypothetical protein [Staphylococcus pseudintermedius]EGQ1698014.1 hypothetical protein [Staphylococcus pseudintermedius]EGQ4383463.1 hypothetical protein [Staphylococcus pseudintermedius]EGQ4391098.1 hypothetical protein [Staphylococcus pseudintermedius]EGQ4412406.1 hypothetical protein [Staphylococcus pseudintermedius]